LAGWISFGSSGGEMSNTADRIPERSKGTISPIRRLREKSRLSQRELAEKCGVSRGRLRRLEGEEFNSATYGELKRIAEVLDVEIRELFEESTPFANGAFLKKAAQTAFQFERPEAGYKIAAYLPAGQDLFVGKLFVSPKRRVLTPDLPRGGTVFIQTLLGSFRVTARDETHEMGEGDVLFLTGGSPYSLENSALRESVAYLFSV